MIETTTPVASQPAAVTPQSSDEGKGNNISAEQLAQRFLQKAQPQETEAAPEAEAAPEDSPEATVSETAADTDQTPEPEAEAVTEEVVETEAEATPEEGEDDDVLSQESALDPKLQAKIDKRIGKEVAKRKTLEQEVAKRDAQIEELKKLAEKEPEVREVVAPTVDDPLANVDNIELLTARWKEAKQAVREAKELLDRDDIDQGVTVGSRTYTKAEVKQYLRAAELDLEENIPKRAQFLQARESTRAQLHADFPTLKDKNSADYQVFQKVLKENPALRGDPAAEYKIALAIEGQKALAARKAAAAKPVPKAPPKPPASQTATAAAAPKPKAPDAKRNADIDAKIAKLKSGGMTQEVLAQIQTLKLQKSR